MGSRWKKSAAARAWVNRQRTSGDWMETLGTLLGLGFVSLIVWFIWKIAKYLFFQTVA